MEVTATWVRVLSSVVVLGAMVSARPEVSAASGGCPGSWSYTWKGTLVGLTVDGVHSNDWHPHQLGSLYIWPEGPGGGTSSCLTAEWRCGEACGVSYRGLFCK